MSHFGVRRGAWTDEEDKLLKECVEKYGVGKWHQVPLRSGLNRCRKSCRLRWLNYLQPNIKRGTFEEDEVDLLFKLRRLLGNRWSLIAGRLPGRNANDVKNYWNTHLRKKLGQESDNIETSHKPYDNAVLVRPQPRTFNKNSLALLQKKLSSLMHTGRSNNEENNNTVRQPISSSSSLEPHEEGLYSPWWDSFCQGVEGSFNDDGDTPMLAASGSWETEEEPAISGSEVVEEETEGMNTGSDFFLDEQLWDWLDNEN